MAKKALLDVLEQTIGKYVKNLDAESLNVALWSGKIELNSLELDVESVNAQLNQRAVEAPNLALPFRVLSGRFESFQVDVPWAHIASRPVVLRARGLSVEVEPVDNKGIQELVDAVNMDTSEEAEEVRRKKLKEAREEQLDTANQYRLQAYNVRKIALAEEREDGNDGNSNSTTFTSRLVRRIIENIQIEITDVHVSLTDSDGSVGACLASLRLMTTDKDGTQVFVDRTGADRRSSTASLDMSFLYKMLQIEGLGIYLDEDEFDNARKSLRSIGEVSSAESGEFDDQSPNGSAAKHSYILAPLSFEARLRQADSNVCIDYAKYHLRSQLSSLSILLNRSQLDFARKLSHVMSPPDTGPKPLFPEYRPMVRIKKGTAKEWWKYAVRCIGRLNGRRSWVEFFRAYQKRKTYIPLFKRQSHHQDCSWIKPLSSKEMDVLVDIELDRSVSIQGLMAWRNIADAQVDKEKQKYDEKMKSKEPGKKSYYSYLFGSSSTETATNNTENEADEEEVAIVLSDDEMRELEGLAKVDLRENELSKDSKLYDTEFVMGSFKVDLVAYDLRHVASLDMGQVSTSFDAAMDGSFTYDFELSDLEIFDRATPQSLFPSVLRMIDQPSAKSQAKAVQFNVSTSSSGDKSLALKIATFEAVASHLMVQAVQRFFRATPHKPASKLSRRANPMLAQSMSGSVDLFYDAQPGDSFMQPPQKTRKQEKARKPLVTRYDLSNALIDAWKEKTETKVSWMMDIDIHAPVILIPEMCSDPRANVLVFDLGNLRLKYGKYRPSPRIQQWFNDNPRETLNEESYDSGTLSISDLTFGVQKARLWQTRKSIDPLPVRESAIIDPTRLSIDFAIESIGSEGNPRFCIFGVVPTISLTVSPAQSSRILPVITSWKNIFGTEGRNEENLIVDASSSESSSSSPSPQAQYDPDHASSRTDVDTDHNNPTDTETYSTFYCNLGLQRLSLTLIEEGQKQLEAHLVSVYASMLQSSDSSSSIGLRMGWFWMLDLMESDFERRQRLVTHSNLPQSARHFSETNDYDILDELKKQGVFEKEYAGSTDLADITYKTLANPVDQVENSQNSMTLGVQTVLDAKFHCLFLHWNPQAIKGITALVGRFLTAVDDDRFSDAGTLIMSPGKSTRRLEKAQRSSHQVKQSQSGRLLVRAEMESLNVILNSAIDDLPLFCLEVAGTSVSAIPRGSGREISIGLGDVTVATPNDMGKTLPQYRTLVGLAPGRSESLLTVRYCSGYDAVKELDLPLNKIENMEAVATVDLSPMRFCYIHSQIMTVVEYVTDGILGALTAQAATSAAEAAKELANSVSGGSLFTIRATSLDLLLPQAPYREEHLGINTASLDVDFYMYNDSRGSHVEVGLSSVVLRDTTASELQEAPIQMSVDVKIPPYGIGEANEQAMSVSLDISGASFVLTKSQYSQIMNTLDENIGDTNLFLRDDDIAGLTVDTTEGTIKPGKMTHAGAQFEERTRSLYLVVGIKELSLALYGRTLEDPIVQVRAVNAHISMSQYPDLGKSSTTVSLQNLFCEDAREIAQSRQYRYLIDRTHEVKEDASGKNIFQIEYTSENDKSNLDFAIGSPRVVLIPDVISEIVSFTRVTRKNAPESSKKQRSDNEIHDETSPLQDQVVQVDSNENEESVETHVRSSNTFVSTIAAKTGTCRFVLVDLGSQLSVDNEATQGGSAASLMSTTTQLTETVILQGTFSAAWSTEYDLYTGKKLSAEFQAHSDAMEMFTAFGREMKSPLQILEPAAASAHGSLRSIGTGDTEIEVRAASLTAMDFSLSMHNAALLSAIMTSLGDSFRYAEIKEAADEAEEQQLTLKEQQRIEQLANALDKIREDESLSVQESGSTLGDSVTSSSFRLSEPLVPTTTKYQIKITMPETRITFINDLQGSDEALFRVSVTNFMAKGDLLSPKTLFECHCNTSILADYFDTSVNLWSRLLIKPWEISMKGSRAPPKRFNSSRLSSTLDLESFPCCISFSEQFLVSLASASRMWSIYTAAITGPESNGTGTTSTKSSMMTATAARNLITSLPHAVANHSGLDATFSLRGGSIEEQACPTGNTKYFRFEPPKGDGYGGRRAYGQDVEVQKVVEINVGETSILVNMDVELGLAPSANLLGQHSVLFTQVVKEGKTTVLHLTSHLEVENNTLLPFDIDIVTNQESHFVGKCIPKSKQVDVKVPSSVGGATSGVDSRKTKRFSIPIPLLSGFDKDWESYGSGTVTLRLKPCTTELENSVESNHQLSGKVDLTASVLELRRSGKGPLRTRTEVTCRSHEQLGISVHPFVLQVVLTTILVADEQVAMTVSLEPRAIIQNRIPVAMKLRTPMPQTYSTSKTEESETKEVTYALEPQERVEVFTPGPSIAITVRPRDTPIAGNELGWMDAGWVDLPLVPEFSLQDPIVSVLPFSNTASAGPSRAGREPGAEIFVVEGRKALSNMTESSSSQTERVPASPRHNNRPETRRSQNGKDPLSFFLTVCHYGVDHTGTILFEQVTLAQNQAAAQALRTMAVLWQSDKNISDIAGSTTRSFLGEAESLITGGDSSRHLSRHSVPQPLGAFASPRHRRRVTLMANSDVPIRLLQMTMDGDEGLKRTLPFMIDQLPIGDGGAATVPVFWEDKTPTGHYAYRCLVNSHQSEIHIVPEFIVFNGGKHVVLVQEKNMPEVIVEGGETGQLRAHERQELRLSFNFIDLECQTSPLRVGKLGMVVDMVRGYDGTPIGSVYVQTVIDTHGDARLVIKVGEVKFGSRGAPALIKTQSFFGEDFCRFRVRWTELQLILNEVGDMSERESWNIRKLRNNRNRSPRAGLAKQTRKSENPLPSVRNTGFGLSPQNQMGEYNEIQMVQQPIMAMIFSRFTVDFQRVFKEGDKKSRRGSVHNSPERSQISVIVHNVQIKDLTPDSLYPMVFDCTSDISFFDLCVRIRGPLNIDLVKVDLFDLNLAHRAGRSEKMVLTTSEAYLWRILDLVNRIMAAGGDMAGFALKFEDDSEHGGYVIKIEDFAKSHSTDSQKYRYTAPKVETFYDIALTRVSPFTLVVSFRRSPDSTRYNNAGNAPGAAITNYFTRKLKFTIDKAELNFARYEDRTLKGPTDRLIETLSTVYVGRMKFKVVSLLSAASLQDWRYLAARDNGDDEYIEGDILRATGNLAGKSAGVVFKVVGQGVGGAVAGASSFVGEGIEGGASKIGARRFGSGVSSVVTGVGYGVGDTLSGVGTGAGKILQGAGQGVGHIFGGISGGALQIGKGIGKGITTGDTSAVVDGFSRGASSVGGGLSQGAESAVLGTADGIFSAGKGIVSGAKNVGQGFGGAIRGKKPAHFQRKNNQQDDGNRK